MQLDFEDRSLIDDVFTAYMENIQRQYEGYNPLNGDDAKRLHTLHQKYKAVVVLRNSLLNDDWVFYETP